MKYYSHYLWESAGRENPVSLVLQQVKLKKGRCLLACICDGSRSKADGSLISGYFTERLVEWFHHQCLPLRPVRNAGMGGSILLFRKRGCKESFV